MPLSEKMFGAVEAGGTKIICGIGNSRQGSIETVRIATSDPDTTIDLIRRFFVEGRERHHGLEAIGIASFGPLNLDPRTADYGAITATPKAGWGGVNLRQRLRDAMDLEVGIDTDVNAAAFAEARLGAARGSESVAYVTVGTGIGVGLVADGRMVHGLGHPEAGHLMVPRHPLHEGFAGVCPFHQACLEGLASGPAIKAAWGGSLDGIAQNHPAWGIEAHYLAHLCTSLILTVAPAHIVLGGGVMSQARLLPMVQEKTIAILGGYAAHWTDLDVVRGRITAPGCAEPSGLLGAYLIAEEIAVTA